jgi:hypothetical protein
MDEAVAATWLLRADDILGGPAHPLLNFSYAQSVREGVPPKVCIQRPNTFMFVGDDWLHGVVNNIGLTVSTSAFSQVSRIYPVPDVYRAEYPVTGHTARSLPRD